MVVVDAAIFLAAIAGALGALGVIALEGLPPNRSTL